MSLSHCLREHFSNWWILPTALRSHESSSIYHPSKKTHTVYTHTHISFHGKCSARFLFVHQLQNFRKLTRFFFPGGTWPNFLSNSPGWTSAVLIAKNFRTWVVTYLKCTVPMDDVEHDFQHQKWVNCKTYTCIHVWKKTLTNPDSKKAESSWR